MQVQFNKHTDYTFHGEGAEKMPRSCRTLQGVKNTLKFYGLKIVPNGGGWTWETAPIKKG